MTTARQPDSGLRISPEDLRDLIKQVESELLSSATFQHNLVSLQNLLGGGGTTLHILLRAVGREAIRLTFRAFAQKYQLKPILNQSSQPNPYPNAMLKSSHNLEAVAFSAVSPLAAEDNYEPLILDLGAQTTHTYEQAIRAIGRLIRRVKQNQDISSRHLHKITFVPLHHIEALEMGNVQALPEPVYLRGFIRRLGDALGLDGKALAAALPTADVSPVPSWYRYQSSLRSDWQVAPLHIYLGYTTVVAGALGGVAFMAYQDQKPPVGPTQPRQVRLPQSVSQPSVGLPTNIAPPETVW